MNKFIPLNLFQSNQTEIGDKAGVIASSLCAIHCLIAPVFLIFAKDFASIWSHPAAHWILASITIPLAIKVILSAGKQHGKKWVIYCAWFGALMIFASLLAPMLVEGSPTCTSGCCPSAQTNADGSWSFNLPLGSLLSIFGGLSLIACHLGNIYLNRCHNNRGSCQCN